MIRCWAGLLQIKLPGVPLNRIVFYCPTDTCNPLLTQF